MIRLRNKRDRNQELQDRFVQLAQRADDAVAQREEVTKREESVIRLRDELRHMRQSNHFTQLFINTVGGPR